MSTYYVIGLTDEKDRNPFMASRAPLVIGTVAAAAILTIAGLAALNAPSSSGAEATVTATPTPTAENPLTAVAQRQADRLMDGLPKGSVKAAAYVTTTSTGYIATLPDTAGFKSLPPGTDVVIVVEIEGWWPAQHSCAPGSECVDTGVFVAYDVTTGATLDTTFEDDPWSRDIPSPGPSVSERFHVLSHWGTPTGFERADAINIRIPVEGAGRALLSRESA